MPHVVVVVAVVFVAVALAMNLSVVRFLLQCFSWIVCSHECFLLECLSLKQVSCLGAICSALAELSSTFAEQLLRICESDGVRRESD